MRHLTTPTPTWRAVAVYVSVVLVASMFPTSAGPAQAQIPDTYQDLVLADGPVAYWRYEETTCEPYSAFNPDHCRMAPTVGAIDGEAFPNVEVGAAGGLVDSGVAPQFTASTSFGSGIYADPYTTDTNGYDHTLQVDDLTLEAWVATSAAPNESMAIAGMDEPGFESGGGYALELDATGVPRGVIVMQDLVGTLEAPSALMAAAGGAQYLQVSSHDVVVVTGDTPINDGAAHHLALTKDESEIRLYVDGELVDSEPTGIRGIVYEGCFCSSSDETPFWVGRRMVADELEPRTFEGVIDEVAVYNRALSTSEVSFHADYAQVLFIARLLQGLTEFFATIGDPVNTVTGNFYHTMVDMDFPAGVWGLDWARSYNSTETLATELGAAWTHTHAVRVETVDAAGVVTVVLADGRHVDFVPDGAGGFGRPDAFYGALVDNGDGTYRADMFNGETWHFDTAGRLAETASWDGQTVSYTYGPDGPTVISSSTGYELTLGYDPDGRVASVTASDGRIVTYGYDASGRLTTTTGPDGDTTSYGFDLDGLMVSVTDPEGVVTVTNVYDPDGRVVYQEFPGGQAASFVYDYPNLETTVTFAPSGETFVHRYDPEGRMVGIVDPAGNDVTMTRRPDGELTGAVSRLGETLTQTFDDAGNVLTSETATGGVTSYAYDTENRLTSITHPWGATTTYTYQGNDRAPTVVTGPDGEVTSYVITDGLVTQLTDPDGVTTSFGYDSRRLLVSTTNGLGDTTTYQHDPAGRLTETTTPLGNTTTRGYDADGRLVSSTDATGAVTSYAYDSAGRLVSTTDPEGAVTTHAYDSAGRLMSVTDPRGQVTSSAYDAFDQVIETTRPGGATSHNTWTDLGRLISTADPAGRVSSFGYDADGNQVTHTDPGGDVTATTRDTAGRVTSVTDPLGRVTTYAYDSSGRLVSATDPTGAATVYGYDAWGRTETVTDPRGGVTTTAYTPGGRVAATTDPNGDTVSYGHDDAGRTQTVTDPEGGVTTYSYDADGRAVSVTSPAGLVTANTYDPAGRPVTTTDPAGVSTTYSYDARGDVTVVARDGDGPVGFDHDDRDLLSVTDSLGNTTSFSHDPRGNRVGVTDALARTQTATFNPADQLTSATDALGRVATTGYDDDGRLETVTDPSGRSVTSSYDAAGQLVAQTFADGSSITYAYDAAGRRIEMADPSGVTAYAYDSAGNLTQVTYPDGDTLGYVYDPAGRRTRLTYPDASVVDYGYDGNGRLSTVSHSSGATATYGYDPDGRLTSETLSDGTTRTYAYTDGRLSEYTQNGVSTAVSYHPSGRIAATTGGEDWTFTYDAAGQLTDVADGSATHSYGYDPVGNLTEKDGVTLTVDDANQLVSGTDGATYTYDAAGRITEETEADGTVLTFEYDDRGLLVTESVTTPGSGDPGADICATAVPTIVGTEGDDVLSGTSGDDVIFGLGGNDVIDGGSGDDIICGGDGTDVITGGSGADILVGGDGHDTLSGGSGPDLLYGGQGVDILEGGSGNDTLDGGPGVDVLVGGSGFDTCEPEPTRVSCEADLPPAGEAGTTVIDRSYDGDGLLKVVVVTRPDASVDTYELTWDKNRPVPQVVSFVADGETTSLVYGTSRAFAVTATGVEAFEYSVLGDAVAGPLTVSSGFDPYGQPDTPDRTAVGFGYRGELHVGGHVYLRHRHLDPGTGRFTTTDPLDGVPGTTTVANRYAYAGNDPVGMVDPLGLRPDDRSIALITNTDGGFEGFEDLGVLETAAFIRERQSDLFGIGIYLGDNRSFADQGPIPPDRSRFFARIDFQLAIGHVEVNETISADGQGFPPWPIVFNANDSADTPNQVLGQTTNYFSLGRSVDGSAIRLSWSVVHSDRRWFAGPLPTILQRPSFDGSLTVRRLSGESLEVTYTGDCFPRVEAQLLPPTGERISVMQFTDRGPIYGLGLAPKCTAVFAGELP